MSLDMLLQILRALESFATEITFVRFEWYMNTNVGGDVITLDCGRVAGTPLARQVEVVSTFTSDVTLANMLL
jgi:hypothetical protein